MADVRESFTTLEGATQEGLALRAVVEGDAVTAKNGSLAFGFKDASGNAVAAPVSASGTVPGAAVPVLAAINTAGNLIEVPVKIAGDAPGNAVPVLGFRDSVGNLIAPQLAAGGALPVTFSTVTGDGKRARGTVGGSATLVTVASLTLATSKIYEDLDFIVSCFRDSRFQVILSDNAVETIVSDAICGPGCTSFHGKMQEAEIATGATGTQLLLIKALNLNALSDFYASLSVKLAN